MPPTQTNEGKQWEGWGTALKPAVEPIVLARKPLSEKNVAENVLKWGTGGINIDACRVPHNEDLTTQADGHKLDTRKQGWGFKSVPRGNEGRFPANLIHDGSEEVVGMFPDSKGAFAPVRSGQNGKSKGIYGDYASKGDDGATFYGDNGSAARFFKACPPNRFAYIPKASKAERNMGLEGFPLGEPPASARSKPAEGRQSPLGQPRQNNHPTVKPVALMRYLCRLITPPNGIVLDPFMGSGSTGIAATMEGFDFIGIEKDEDYFKIAEARITKTLLL